MTFADLVDLIIQLARYSALPGVAFFLLFGRVYKPVPTIVFFILLASFLGDFLSYAFAKYIYPNNHPILNIWHILNGVFGLIYFYFIHKRIRRITVIVGVAYLLLAALTHAIFYSFFESNTFIWTSSSFLMIIYSIYTYIAFLKEPTIPLKKILIFGSRRAYSFLALLHY